MFDRVAKEGIVGGGPNGFPVSHLVSAFNTFKNVGNGQRIPVLPETEATPDSSVIYFNGDNCYSFGDTFARSSGSAIPAIDLNSKASFATLSDGRTILGKLHTAGGSDTVLADGVLTPITVGVIGFEDYPTIIEYTVVRNSLTGSKKRIGTLHITPIAGETTFSDDYVETDDLGISLVPTLNNNTVELTYTSSVERFNSILTLSSRTLIGSTAPARLLDSVPDAPTNVAAALIISAPSSPQNVVATLVSTVSDAPTNVVASLLEVPDAPTNVVASLA